MPAKKRKIPFEQFYDRFLAFEDRVDGQFHKVAIRFDQLEQNFRSEIARLEERIRNIDTNLEKLTGDVETLTQEYHAIVAGLKRLESQVSELSEEAFSQLQSLKNRVSTVEDRVLALESQ
jgi:archaellum component FlaC